MECKEEATFIISGRGELEMRLRERAHGLDNIKFLGFLPAKFVPQIYSAADVFVMPSEMETQGIVILEAMAAGTACIGTDVGITRDVVEPERIIPFRDHQRLAQVIDSLLSDPYPHRHAGLWLKRHTLRIGSTLRDMLSQLNVQ